MYRSIASIVAILLILPAGSLSAKDADYAGEWYTASGSSLKKEIKAYLDGAGKIELPGEAVGFLVPHAGISISGPVAAYSYKAAAQMRPRTVIVVGFTHKKSFSGVSVFTDSSFNTPLGKAYTDMEITRELLEFDPALKDIPRAFDEENSIEMQIPFIQCAMPGAKIVLIAMGDREPGNIQILSDALHKVLVNREGYVIMGSTDLSHYLSYDDANRLDRMTISGIKKGNADKFYSLSSQNQHRLLCGVASVCAVMTASAELGADEVVVLKYANSGDVTGRKGSVVGYLSAAFVKGRGDDMLNDEQRDYLLRTARDTIKYYLETGGRLDIRTDDELLKQDMGAFVTLHKNGQLRGCIGHMVASGPLYITVRDMAIAAAVQDPRFDPVTLDELEDIDIEISVLSPMKSIDDPEVIQPGKHGVMVKRGFRSGVYLPQVAVETGWDREQFMNSLCAHKAGIPVDSWKTGDCDMYIFTAEVFGEKDHE